MGQAMRHLAILMIAAVASSQNEEFEVVRMLQAAVAASGASGSKQEADHITQACLPAAAQDKWRTSFKTGVDTMLQKTKRSMQHGLGIVAQSVATLLQDSSSCGKLKAFEHLAERAERLRVLATARSLASLDTKVRYEPLKALTVGGIDIHSELNQLIVAWQMRRGAQDVGTALAGLLADFASETDATQDASPSTGTTTKDPSRDSDRSKQSPGFWTTLLNQALRELGHQGAGMEEACVSKLMAVKQAESMDNAFAEMMKKTRRSMQAGLKMLTEDLLETFTKLEQTCRQSTETPGAKKLQSAASRLHVLAGSKSLVNLGGQVQYEALRSLKVGGVDVHIQLNKLIASWLHGHSPLSTGTALGQFLREFLEQDEAEEPEDRAGSKDEIATIIWRAMATAGGDDQHVYKNPACFPAGSTDTFVKELEAAMEQMLQKRMKTMQLGLRGMADATDKLFQSMRADCVVSPGARVMWRAARKLKKLTRRAVVDYGTHIKYEAMKSLTVGGVPVHTELNEFLASWKLRGRLEASEPFGRLMIRLAEVHEQDEL